MIKKNWVEYQDYNINITVNIKKENNSHIISKLTRAKKLAETSYPYLIYNIINILKDRFELNNSIVFNSDGYCEMHIQHNNTVYDNACEVIIQKIEYVEKDLEYPQRYLEINILQDYPLLNNDKLILSLNSILYAVGFEDFKIISTSEFEKLDSVIQRALTKI